ncbi:MAG: hypothetical protein BGO07_01440 [Alphaproteobacteria bacterium 40-19]|nr:MAG: hypothetical protein BGO07_01440 [Alphaproteobacteria bacterium 40-19]
MTRLHSTKATAIKIEALPGQEEDLATLLNQASVLVSDNEPATHVWYALRLSKNTFMIFDTFSDESGRAAHFAGKAASALKEHSERLIVGGWEKGVVANIENYDIISGFSR